MLNLSFLLGVVLPPGLVRSTVLAGFAHDIQRQSDSHRVPVMSE
jgi:hypothetical protein